MIPIVVSPYMYNNVIENHIPFILFYNYGVLLEGEDAINYKLNNTLHKGILEGFWDESFKNYCLKEKDCFELSVYFEYMTEKSYEGLCQYLNGMGMLVCKNLKEFWRNERR